MQDLDLPVSFSSISFAQFKSLDKFSDNKKMILAEKYQIKQTLRQTFAQQ